MGQALNHGALIGSELGHYRVIEKVGEGGMGEVFLARDEHLGHNVALKVLPPGTDDRGRQLFRKEAKALSKLNHPNIVTVIDFDTQDNVDFLVMEYVPGLALDEKVRQGVLREREIVRIGVQLAEGLAAAHAQGVIHRDLKPGNLRLTKDDRLKILDFGLAWSTLRLGPLASTLSFNGSVDCSGTLPYMATEQLAGLAVDARTDIYSAGAVLYELYTGRAPFEQKLFTALVDEILHRAPVPPSHVRPGISPRLEAIILKCLEKDPEKRYQSAEDLLRDLRELANAQGAPAASRLGGRLRFYLLAACLALLALATVLGWRNRSWMDTLRNQGALHIESLAVLPFSNFSGDSQQEYLADGMTDSLITDLGQMHALQRIISRTSVMRYKSEPVPLRDVARQLKVDAVIEGAVMRSGQTVQVTVRLVSAADDRQLWSHRYESEFRDLLTLQHEMALALAREIRINLSAGDRARLATAHPVEPAAQEAYLKAEYLKFGNAEQRAKSRQYFEQAIQQDPNYAPAYAGLADAYWNDVDLPPRETMPKARDYALKAVALDDTVAHAHTSLATVRFYGDWNWAEADREYQRALQLNPGDAEAHRMYSVFLAAMGRADEAWVQVSAAQGLDPLYADNNATAGWDLYCARRYDQAMEQCQRALELAPNDKSTHSCLSYAHLGKGQYPQAIEEGMRAWTLSGKDTVWMALLGRIYAQEGNVAEAHRILAQLLLRSRQTYVPPYFITALYAALGNRERALQWLDRAYTERDLYLAGIKVDQAVDPLRSDARFQELERRVGFSP
ncbi:MAG: protein kinase [Candidatus Sulfotelmatobacter sp.]|jgi:serine/threonine-protein kinase